MLAMPATITAHASTPALRATPALPTTDALATVPALPTTPALQTVAALPTTPLLALVAALPTGSSAGADGEASGSTAAILVARRGYRRVARGAARRGCVRRGRRGCRAPGDSPRSSPAGEVAPALVKTCPSGGSGLPMK